MNDRINYNGKSQKRRFHKLKKHADILKKRMSYKKQKKEIESLDNSLLSVVFKSIFEVKNSNYCDADQDVFKTIDLYRKELSRNSESISYGIFNSTATKQVKEIYEIAASPKVWGELLYFLTKNSQSKKVLEIGTNVGVSGAYILNGMKQSNELFKFITMEGLDQLCSLSNEQFSKITSKNNFYIVPGLYDNTFPKLVDTENDFDLLFIDGNHQKKPTLEYFEELKKCIKDKAIFIFDDIYFNMEMTEAWETIIDDESVTYSIDLYKWGIVIIDESEKIKNKRFGIHLSY